MEQTTFFYWNRGEMCQATFKGTAGEEFGIGLGDKLIATVVLRLW